MSARLLISALPGDLHCALLEDERLADFLVLRAGLAPLPGDLYLARVQRHDEGLGAAFVDIGEARPALLPDDQVAGRRPSEGAAVAVKVIRAPAPGKGAKVTARLTAEDLAQADIAAVSPPARLAGGDPLLALLRHSEPEEILVDDPDVLLELKARLSAQPQWQGRLLPYRAATPLFEAAAVAGEIERLLEPEVPLPSGGNLLIEPVTTLSAIDVNAGRHSGQGGVGAVALAVDLEAAAEIARQLRLRALAGLIVVDFLALERKDERARVTRALKEALARDPVTSQVEMMRASGLVELTRKRARPPLHEILTEPCAHCPGGRRKSAASLAFEALRAARAAGLANPGPPLTLEVAPALLAALEGGPATAAARALAVRFGGRLGWRLGDRRESDEVAKSGFRLVLG